MEIEKNVPLRDRLRGGPRKYPFDRMEVGDSVVICTENAISAKVCANQYGKRAGKQFATRVEGEGIRVWRIA